MRPARLDHTFFDNEPRSHLGAMLLRKGLITNDELDRALEEKQQGELLGEALVIRWQRKRQARGMTAELPGSRAGQRAR